MENLKHFDLLNKIDVSGKIEKKKSGKTELSYLSWAWAWGELKKEYPCASYEIQKFNGLPYVFDPLTGYMVYTKMTIENITHEMWLPVMDGANKAMKSEKYIYLVQKKEWSKTYNKFVLVTDENNNQVYEEKIVEAATMFDINKTIMRCLVKNIAMFGLGLYIYAGEDLPENETEDTKIIKTQQKTNNQNSKPKVNTNDLKLKLESAVDLEGLVVAWKEIFKVKHNISEKELEELENLKNELKKKFS